MNKKYLFHLSVIFVIIEITLEIIAQTSIGNRWTDYFAVILACLFFILFTEQSTSYVFTQIGLIFTVVADYFLVYNLNIILKSRDITLPTKVRLVKAMVFPVVMYGCEES